jgi:hypothetical protein
MEIERGRATVRMRLNGLALTDLAEFTRLVVGAERYDNHVQGRAHRRHY